MKLTAFNLIVVQVQRSFIKTKTQNDLFLKKYFEFINIHISHFTQLPMITMALK
jgi:hypothetical protein